MNQRQRYALTHPVDEASLIRLTTTCKRTRQLDARLILSTVLAVDRSARLNDGAPVWHVSASLQAHGRFILAPDRLEAISIDLLLGVGGDVEWWLPVGESNPAVSHFRVPTTSLEQTWIPAGLVTMDAGPEGTLRSRTRR